MKHVLLQLVATAARGVINTALRLASLGPALNARAGRIPLEIDEIAALKPGPVVIFACYPKTPVEDSILAVLKRFTAGGAQVVAVATVPFPPPLREKLAAFASVLIEMPNIGRDFGAYQQGVSYVQRKLGLEQASRLIFLNDSIYFFERADSQPLVDAMLDPAADYVGSNENFFAHYHIGSFLFAVGGPIPGHPTFARFWQRYIPFSTRPHAINAGEVGLSRTIMATGAVPRVLYQLADIAADVAALVARRDGREDYLLSMRSRRIILGDVRRYSQIAQISSDDAAAGAAFASLAGAREADVLLEFLQNNNQVHFSGLLLTRFANMPFVKKDLVYRGIQLLPDVVTLCAEQNLDSRENIVRMFRPRKTPSTFRGLWERLLSQLGII